MKIRTNTPTLKFHDEKKQALKDQIREKKNVGSVSDLKIIRVKCYAMDISWQMSQKNVLYKDRRL